LSNANLTKVGLINLFPVSFDIGVINAVKVVNRGLTDFAIEMMKFYRFEVLNTFEYYGSRKRLFVTMMRCLRRDY